MVLEPGHSAMRFAVAFVNFQKFVRCEMQMHPDAMG
jgi:hypothetical protein